MVEPRPPGPTFGLDIVRIIIVCRKIKLITSPRLSLCTFDCYRNLMLDEFRGPHESVCIFLFSGSVLCNSSNIAQLAKLLFFVVNVGDMACHACWLGR